MVNKNDSDSEEEEVNTPSAPLPVQSTTMLNFFKRLNPPNEKKVEKLVKKDESLDRKRKKDVVDAEEASDAKVLKNGTKSQSPPAKKRITEDSDIPQSKKKNVKK